MSNHKAFNTSDIKVFSDIKCQLGEGPLWHPLRHELLWFDITNNTLHAQNSAKHQQYTFEQNVSALAWIDQTSVLVSAESGLVRLSLDSGATEPVLEIEAGNSLTRSNDGRADRQHGFWISTMGKNAEESVGAIYRYYKGELRCLHKDITIPNAICFSPSGDTAYFADSMKKRIFKQDLDIKSGWPISGAEIYIDFADQNITPDGAVIDVSGNIWIAFWGEGAVEGFSPHGKNLGKIKLPTPHTTCPAFGGPDCSTLFVTTAMQGLDHETLNKDENAGKTFTISTEIKGLSEPQVLLL